MDSQAFVAGMSALGAGMAMIAGLGRALARVTRPVKRARRSGGSPKHRAISLVR